jgi:FMN phosphatase YigB (HAD superfamily)
MSTVLTIFDFDDTLIKSETEIIIQHADGSMSYLDSEEYARYEEKPGDKFDYSNFDKYPKNPKRISDTFKELEASLGRGDHVIILTARSNRIPVEDFMRNHGYNVEIITVGSVSPIAKANVVMNILRSRKYDLVQVFEDNSKNIRAIKKIVSDEGVRFKSTVIDASHRSRLLEIFLRKS